MGFIRRLGDNQLHKLTDGCNAELFSMLKSDILCGDPDRAVFPAIRKDEIDFYYKGGCLYRYSHGTFKRDKNYTEYGTNADGLSQYERAKTETENKYTRTDGAPAERNLLNDLYCHTFYLQRKTAVVVLDIEVNLNGNVNAGKKCDLVLYNTDTAELMFVEGKVFHDRRVNVQIGHIPEVIKQVNLYTAALAEQRQAIIEQYNNHVRIVNALFGTHYAAPAKLIEPAKLLVYNTPEILTGNQAYSIAAVNSALGINNVAWYNDGKRPATDEIWSELCK